VARKLTDDSRRQLIHEWLTSAVTQVALATKYGVTQAHVSKLVGGLTPDDIATTVTDPADALARARVRKRGGRLTDADVAAVRALRGAGTTLVELAHRFGVSTTYVVRLCKPLATAVPAVVAHTCGHPFGAAPVEQCPGCTSDSAVAVPTEEKEEVTL
jgi:hypothetical protein